MRDNRRPGLALEARGLRKSYGRQQVLRSLDLDVAWGQVVAVLGPNGSGKTTLIKVLATLARPDGGQVRVAGVDALRQGARARRLIGVVTHEPMLYENMTAYENLLFHGRLFGLRDLRRRIQEVAELLGIEGRLHQRTGALSHGLRKRVSIARALLHDPPVLLMDEPESGLDQDALSLLEGVLRDATRPHRAVLMTTHNLERGTAMADQVAILSGGRIAYREEMAALDLDDLRTAYRQVTGATP